MGVWDTKFEVKIPRSPSVTRAETPIVKTLQENIPFRRKFRRVPISKNKSFVTDISHTQKKTQLMIRISNADFS